MAHIHTQACCTGCRWIIYFAFVHSFIQCGVLITWCASSSCALGTGIKGNKEGLHPHEVKAGSQYYTVSLRKPVRGGGRRSLRHTALAWGGGGGQRRNGEESQPGRGPGWVFPFSSKVRVAATFSFADYAILSHHSTLPVSRDQANRYGCVS